MRIGFFVVAALAATSLSPSYGQAVTVIGGGMARECYEAVETSRGSKEEAMRMCDLALNQENLSRHNRAATYINRGILFMRDARFERALLDFENGIRNKPELLEAKVNYGAALYNVQRYQDALTALNVGITTEDIRAKAVGHYNRALTLEKLGDVTAAYYDFKTALDLQPDFKLAADQLTRFKVTPASEATQQ
jgi:tetratricopeptide (TPR) repeat protein